MIHILVHDKKDTVGVIVVEGVKAGQELIGWVMEDDSTIKVKALNDVPIGHKVATKAIKNGFDIGKAVSDIKVGEHAHVHNIKTKRW
jgi:(2R)-sulfolactate sulfo-lyase subunit alpha